MTHKMLQRVSPSSPSFDGAAYTGYRVHLRLVRENTDCEPVQLREPVHVYDFMKELEHADRERLYSIHLDNKNHVTGCEEVSSGSVSYSAVHFREIFKAAILASATSIIMVHNHTSGDPTPSADDQKTMLKLYEAGELLGIPLQDSVIVGFGKYYSFAVENPHWPHSPQAQ